MDKGRAREAAHLHRLVAVAARRAPADLVFTNARIVNVHSGEIEEGNVAVVDGWIAGIGRTRRPNRQSTSVAATSRRD